MNNQERQELAEWLRNEIKLTEAARDEIPFGLDHSSEMALKSFKVALASLEAPQPEPVAYTSQANLDVLAKKPLKTLEFMTGDKSVYRNPVSLYTALPAPVRQPVKFTDCDFGAVSHMSGGSKDYCNGFVDGTQNAMKLIRAAGYPVEK